MALALDIMKGGFSAGSAKAIGGQANTAVSAAGTAITDATDLVDAGLVGRYVTPFADIAASPATPKKIALIARYFAAGLALQRYYSDRSNIDDETE